MFVRLAAGLAAALAAWPALAQDDHAARRAVAAEYIGLQLETTDFDAMAAQFAGMLLARIEQEQPQLYERKADRLNDMVTSAMAQSIRDGMIGLDDDMAQAFSLEELTALRDFYASPEGRAVMSKMPGFMAEVMPRIMQQSLAISGRLLEDLRNEGVIVR